MIMEERPEDLQRLAAEAEENGRLLDALRLHERLLLAQQRYHPDPSHIVDQQKIKLCEVILDFEESEAAHQITCVRHASHNASSGATGCENGLSDSYVGTSATPHRSIAVSADTNTSGSVSGAKIVGGGGEGGGRSSSATVKRRAKPSSSPTRGLSGHQQHSHHKIRVAHPDDSNIVLPRHAPLLTEALSLQGLLAFGDRLLSDGNVLPETQHNPRLIRARGRMFQSLAAILYKQKRPRAGVPLAQAALKKFKLLVQPPNFTSVEVVKAYLGLCTVLSASNKHKEALQCIITALEMTDLLELEYAANKPSSSSHHDDTLSHPHHRDGAGSRLHPSTMADAEVFSSPNVGDTNRLPQPLFRYPPPKRLFVGPLEAACYHNAGVELEHLALQELALVCYRAGHDIAADCLGPQHPLTMELYKVQVDLFVSLNYKHFYPDGRRPGEKSTAFDDPNRALKQLNYSYVASQRHKSALERDEAKARVCLQHSLDPLMTMSFVIPPSSTLVAH